MFCCARNGILQLCDHKTDRMCSHHGAQKWVVNFQKGFCSITQLLSQPKIWKSHCAISQEPFLYSVRTLSAQDRTLAAVCFEFSTDLSCWSRMSGYILDTDLKRRTGDSDRASTSQCDREFHSNKKVKLCGLKCECLDRLSKVVSATDARVTAQVFILPRTGCSK